MKKTCTKCRVEKDAALGFSKNKRTKSGYNFWCKLCIHEARKILRLDPLRRSREAALESTRRVKDRINNPEKYKRWKKSNYSAHKKRVLETRASHPKRFRASDKVKYQLKKGAMTKPLACEKCLEVKKLCAHHDDYDQPLNVRWLCSWCHSQWHKENGDGRNKYN